MARSPAKQHLGVGWRFPVALGADQRLEFSRDEAKIQESIMIILGTARGERVMRPDFGSRLQELVFSPINSSTKSLVADAVIEALVAWEPRIDVVGVVARESAGVAGTLEVSIDYRVRATNSTFNLVYPLYLREGADASATG